MKLKCFDIDLKSEINIQLKKLLTVVDNNEPVEYDDFDVQSMIFAMVKEINDISQKTNKRDSSTFNKKVNSDKNSTSTQGQFVR